MFKFIKIILQILQHPESISSGISYEKEMIRHCLVKKNKDRSVELLLCRDHIPWWLSIVSPMVVHTDLNNKPVILCNELIGEEDPDIWIDRNEEKIIPKGFVASTIVNEYTVNGPQILSATITTRDRQEFLNEIENYCIPLSLSIPLWDIARMYWDHLQEPFVLWKVTHSGSILGYIDNGMVIRICNLWPDCSDLLDNPDESVLEIVSVIKKLAGNKVPVIAYTSAKDFVFPVFKTQTGLNLMKAPDIKGVLPHNHEVFAIACHNESSLNFVPFDKIQKARNTLKGWQSLWSWLRRGIYTVIVSIVVLASIAGGLRVSKESKHQIFSDIKVQIATLTQATAKRDSLIRGFKKSGQFADKESALTELLNKLQVEYPECLWADEIDISENGDSQWRLEMIVYAKAASMLGKFMSNMHSMEGVSDVRMVYSEQVTTKKGEKVIKFRIECVWKRM